MVQPILQFGTGRFLQAHVDLFVAQALALGQGLGGIAVVQSTDSAASSARLAALAAGHGYTVELRGLQSGTRFEQQVHVDSVRAAWHAGRDWARLRADVATQVQVIVSNTAERGFELDPGDGPELLAATAPAPRSYPAKLLVLLHGRWLQQPGAPLSIYPCELISRNGDFLRERVVGLAAGWRLGRAFESWLREHCVWVNSLVDRIVSQPLLPLGAVAEPYALWAIERQPRLLLPCTHPAMVLTDDLASFERLKLLLLNGGHSWLAERWLLDRRPAAETVHQAMLDTPLRAGLEQLWQDELLPLFDALGDGDKARRYLVELRERLLNPFLQHRLHDIARDHTTKKQRRFAPAVALARELGLVLEQPRLHAALAGQPHGP